MKRRMHPLEVSDASEVFHMKLWEGTISEYPFDRYSGTLSGGTGTPVSSPPGFDFIAANTQYIDIGTGPASVKTISLWVKPDDIAGVDPFIDLNGVDTIGATTGTVDTGGFAGGTTIFYTDGVAAATTITANWHHIVVTSTTARNASNLDIGRVEELLYFDGAISDVRLYSLVRTDAQIRDFYEQTRWRYGV